MSVYRPILLDPNSSSNSERATLDMLQIQTVSAIVQSTTTDYQVNINKISDNTLLYDSTKITLGSPVYAGNSLDIELPIIVALAGIANLKWTLRVWNGVDEALSRETPFLNYEEPVTTMTVPASVNGQSYEFSVTYTQPQSAEISRYRLTLYDDAQIEITNSGWIYNSSGVYTFENFIDGQDYYVRSEVYDINTVYSESPLYGFVVDYTKPSVTFVPVATNKKYLSAIEIEWSGAYLLEGSATGVFTYQDDFLYMENTGVNIPDGSYIEWTGVNIGAEYVASLFHNPLNGTFTGDIIKFENDATGIYQCIGYDSATQRFYRNQNELYDYTSSFSFDENNVYLIMFTAESIHIKVFFIE